jgi:hypothetical protein
MKVNAFLWVLCLPCHSPELVEGQRLAPLREAFYFPEISWVTRNIGTYRSFSSSQYSSRLDINHLISGCYLIGASFFIFAPFLQTYNQGNFTKPI